MTKRTKAGGHVCDYRCGGDNGHHAWPSPAPKRTKAKPKTKAPKVEAWALLMDGKQLLYFEHEDVALEEAGLHGHANPGSQFEVVHLASEALARELLANPRADAVVKAALAWWKGCPCQRFEADTQDEQWGDGPGDRPSGRR